MMAIIAITIIVDKRGMYMAFTWTENIEADEFVMPFHVEEVRNNIDIVHDNLACVTYNTTHKSDHDQAYHSTRRDTYCSTHYPGHDNDLHSNHHGNHQTSYRYNTNSGYDSNRMSHDVRKVNHDGGYRATYDGSWKNYDSIDRAYDSHDDIGD